MFFLAIISGLRGVGTDYVGYNSGFLEIITGVNEYVNYESGYIMLLRVLGNIGLNFQILMFITSVVFIYAIFSVYRVYEDDINFPLAVFLCYVFIKPHLIYLDKC